VAEHKIIADETLQNDSAASRLQRSLPGAGVNVAEFCCSSHFAFQRYDSSRQQGTVIQCEYVKAAWAAWKAFGKKVGNFQARYC